MARVHDVLIASVAISRGLDLCTANSSDFEGIDGLTVHPLHRS